MAHHTALRFVTWNVHRAKGTDGRRAPDRILQVIADQIAPLHPDVLALQEADEEVPPHAGILDIDGIEAATGLQTVHDSASLRWGAASHGFLGTILFAAPHLQRSHAAVIDLPGHCHRGAIAVELRDSDRRFRVISTHLSLFQPLRAVQMRVIGQYIQRRPAMQTILLGDLNEWRPWGGLILSPRLVGTAFRGPLRASFPSGRPVLPLDRILTDHKRAVQNMQVISTGAARVASDHLPVFAEVTVS